MQDGRRSESFTFAPVSPTRVAAKDDRSIVRATASEPVEVLTFPRLGNGHGLRHGASMPAFKVGRLLYACAAAVCWSRTVGIGELRASPGSSW